METPTLICTWSQGFNGLLNKKCDLMPSFFSKVRDVLEQRTQEELTTELSVSIYDTARNDTAKKRREEIVR